MKKYNLTKAALLSIFLVSLLVIASSCKDSEKKKGKKESTEMSSTSQVPFFEISLAQWSLHKAILDGSLDPYDFAKKSSELGFSAIEYVSALYKENINSFSSLKEGMAYFIKKSKEESEKYNVRNWLIMIDREGNLATTDEAEQNQSVENHKVWVNAAAELGCSAIRVNLSGATTAKEWTEASVKGLSKLADYAATKNINVTVENHGGFSSNGQMLATVMEKVNKPNCGTLPDFGNFCIKRSSNGCEEKYDNYKGMKELMPHALAVSAKTYNFDPQTGEETNMSFKQILQIVKDAGYTKYIGIEYEGSGLSEEDGILATKKLLIEASKNLK